MIIWHISVPSPPERRLDGIFILEMWHLRYLIKTFQHNSPRVTQQGKGQKHSDLRKYLRSAEKV